MDDFPGVLHMANDTDIQENKGKFDFSLQGLILDGIKQTRNKLTFYKTAHRRGYRMGFRSRRCRRRYAYTKQYEVCLVLEFGYRCHQL